MGEQERQQSGQGVLGILLSDEMTGDDCGAYATVDHLNDLRLPVSRNVSNTSR